MTSDIVSYKGRKAVRYDIVTVDELADPESPARAALGGGGNTSWKGAWDSLAAYVTGDTVSHNGKTWVAEADQAAGVEPTPPVTYDQFTTGHYRETFSSLPLIDLADLSWSDLDNVASSLSIGTDAAGFAAMGTVTDPIDNFLVITTPAPNYQSTSLHLNVTTDDVCTVSFQWAATGTNAAGKVSVNVYVDGSNVEDVNSAYYQIGYMKPYTVGTWYDVSFDLAPGTHDIEFNVYNGTDVSPKLAIANLDIPAYTNAPGGGEAGWVITGLNDVDAIAADLADDFVSRTAAEVNGDLNIVGAGAAIFLVSPGGARYKITVDDAGVVTTVSAPA